MRYHVLRGVLDTQGVKDRAELFEVRREASEAQGDQTMSRRRRPEKPSSFLIPSSGCPVEVREQHHARTGKKSVAENIVHGAPETVETRAKKEPMGLFHDAPQQCEAGIEVRSRRVGGATYQVPVEVRPERFAGSGDPLADFGCATAAKTTMAARLSGELRSTPRTTAATR